MSLNWKIFGLKYDKKETWAFEQLSYLLFCAEFNNRIGLFRYKNQTGIETDPFEKEGRYYGFQAKFYSNSISDNKDDIIDSIRKAKSKNSRLEEIFFYINQEFSESSSVGKKKPGYQIEIENAALAVGLSVQWRVPSHFEVQLSLPENKYIYDMFFSLEPSVSDLLDEVSKHNEKILDAIQTAIPLDEKQIKIDRTSVNESLSVALKERKHIIISGEGGCGKTAVFKEFYIFYKKEFPICVFKASELKVNNINDIFHFDYQFTFLQFLSAYKDNAIKVFVIDSAEKMAEFENNDILSDLIRLLLQHEWQIVFTTRNVYLNDLSFHLKENYSLSFVHIDIPLIKLDELNAAATFFGFPLPENKKFAERLCNLFYLREYIRHKPYISEKESYNEFINVLWKKRIQRNSIAKDNMHLQRESCIITFAERRCKSGRFYINLDDQSQSALYQLRQDEILGYDDMRNAYFITHDIYEEWALDKIVSRKFLNRASVEDFFVELGNSLPIRRAFRLWMSNQLSEINDELENFVRDTFRSTEISTFWTDEFLISILLSDYAQIFFKSFKKEVIADDHKFLKRIFFLLRIACTDVSECEELNHLRPMGRGWECAIRFICDCNSTFVDDNLKVILPVLKDWTKTNKNGAVTRLAGQLALRILDNSYLDCSISKNTERSIFSIIFNSACELQNELKTIFDKVIANKWVEGNNPYESFCSEILKKPYEAFELIKTVPLSVIQLCDLFWQKKPRKEDDFWGEPDTMESRYGLSGRFDFNYHPSSANQTPIRWLLQAAFHPTLDFIIAFTNRAVECYKKSDYGRKDVELIKLHVDDKEVFQYICDSFWNMYRGTSSPVVPSVLQSIHMALERILLDFAKNVEPEVITPVLLKILIQSKSASLTSVVCSVVLANTEKFYNIALILFKTIELFRYDTSRLVKDSTAKTLYSIGCGMNRLNDVLYFEERQKTCDEKHRKTCLESLFLNYQFLGVKGFSEEQNSDFIKKLYNIIDSHKSNSAIVESYGLLLARMDRRNLRAKISSDESKTTFIEFEPKELSDELKKKSDEALNRGLEMSKYASLKLWSDFIFGAQNQMKNTKFDEYDNNPLLALRETKQLIEELKKGRGEAVILDYATPAHVCSKMILEYRELLSEEEKDFCKKIIVDVVFSLFDDDYGYQIGDGVEAAVRAIPALLNVESESFDVLVLIMVLVLLDQNSLGEYKRVCDYAIESIHKSNSWVDNPEFARAVLYKYIKIIPVYEKIVNEKRREFKRGCSIKKMVLQEVAKECLNIENTAPDIEYILALDFRSLEVVLQLIPSDTKERCHLEIFEKTLPLLFPKLFEHERLTGKDKLSFSLKHLYFKIFSQFLLHRNMDEIDFYLKPIISSFDATQETVMFVQEMISLEDRLNKDEQFWHVWKTLYPQIKELCTSSQGHYLDELIINYLLAWNYWRENAKEWHCLKKDNIEFFTEASKEIGHIPSVLYSISRFLNTIGSYFENEGVEWVHSIVSRNIFLDLDDFEEMTLFYMESFVRKFVFENRQKFKENIGLKNKIIDILEFMVERKSVRAYLLREEIL